MSKLVDGGENCKGGERIILSFAEIDALSWQELEKLPDDDLSEFLRLSNEARDALTPEEWDAIIARDDTRFKRKYCGRLPEEIEEERDFDVSKEPEFFQELWAIEFSELTTAEREWRRSNRWLRGSPENPIDLPDDVEIDGSGSPSEQARQLWHRRVYAMTRDEFEDAYADSINPRNIARCLISDEQERRETALLRRGVDETELDALSAEIKGRIAALPTWSPAELDAIISTMTAEKKMAAEARRSRLAAWRRHNEEIEQAAHKQAERAKETPPTEPQPQQEGEPTRGYEALKAHTDGAKQAKAAQTIHWVRASDLAKRPMPKRSWLIRNLIPGRNVTLFTADGGTGKSTLALQLGVGTAVTGRWMGMPIEVVEPVLYYAAEDETNENQIRLGEICRAEGIDLADVDDLHFAPLAGLDAMLSSFDRNGGMTPSPLWGEVCRKADAVRPKLVIIDTAADVFAGDENKRKEVRQFIGQLRGLALDFDCAVLLLAHPSVSGMIDGTGRSGKTGWNNSVRSRLNFERVIDRTEGRPIELDRNIRLLTNNKLNYGEMGMALRVRWINGVFVREDSQAGAPSATTANKMAEDAFLDCLRLFESQGREVSTKSGANYAPTQFARLPEAKGLNKVVLRAAMERLLVKETIRLAHEKGADYKMHHFLTTKPAVPDPVSEVTAHDPETGEILESAAPAPEPELSPVEVAMQFLRERLSAGPVPQTEVLEDAKGSLITEKTLRRAATKLGVKAIKEGRIWRWHLP